MISSSDIDLPSEYAKLNKVNVVLNKHGTKKTPEQGSDLIIPNYNIKTNSGLIREDLLSILPDNWMNFNVDLINNPLYITDKLGNKIQLNSSHVSAKMIEHYCNEAKLSNMGAFTEVRECFEATGRYCEEVNPLKKEKFWKRELERSRKGFHNGADYITGYNYFYWNYCPIEKHKIIDDVTANTVNEFCDIWDIDYYFFHYIEECERMGLHALVAKARRKGLSFKAGAMLNRNFHCIPNSKGFAIADVMDFLDEDGTLSKAWSQMNFIDKYTGFATRKQEFNNSTHKKASYWYVDQDSDNDVKLVGGLQSEIFGLSINGKPNKLRGKSGKLYILEEFGSNPYGEDVLKIIRPSVEQADLTYGLILAYGTGGDESGGFKAMEKFVRKPALMNFHSIKNLFERDRLDEDIAFFIPENIGRQGFIDEEGNSDIVNAAVRVITNRLRQAEDPSLMYKMAAETPLTIDEFCLTTANNTFDTIALSIHLTNLKTDPQYTLDKPEYGFMSTTANGKVTFRHDPAAIPILTFPFTGNNKDGCIIIYKHPAKIYREGINTDKTENLRYIGALDPVDFDLDEVTKERNRLSLQSGFILDTVTRDIVAEYTGRPANVDTYFGQFKLLLEYFNAKALFETNIKGAMPYFKSRMLYKYLGTFPKVLSDMIDVKESTSYGYKTTPKINSYARNLINKWLMEEVPVIENGETVGTTFRYTHIRAIALLQELINWRRGNNYDRVSALQVLMVYLLEYDTYICNTYVKQEATREDQLVMYYHYMNAQVNALYDANAKGDPLFDAFK